MKKITLCLLALIFLFISCGKNDQLEPIEDWTPSQSIQVVVLEQTGTWCGACPNGASVLRSLDEEYGDQIVPIAIHGSNNDPMQISCYSNFRSDRSNSKFPSFFITENRISTSLSTAKTKVNNKLSGDVNAAIAIKKTINANDIIIETKTKFFNAMEGDYYLSVYITEDDIDGGTGSGAYKQSNGGSNYKHDHVLRASATDNNFWGELIASEPIANNSIEKTYTIAKETNWVDEIYM